MPQARYTLNPQPSIPLNPQSSTLKRQSPSTRNRQPSTRNPAPTDPRKVNRCRKLGANVVLQGAHIGEAKDHALSSEEYKGLQYINGE